MIDGHHDLRELLESLSITDMAASIVAVLLVIATITVVVAVMWLT